MGVVTATELPTLAGKLPSSSAFADASPAVPDEEALSNNYIPADGLSACLITPHRILVTAGATEHDRVLPFSVIRYLDLSPSTNHTWTKPQHLRRRRGSTDIPVPRVEHSLTFVPHDSRLYLFGGMKIDPDMGDICKTLFAFDPRNKGWQRVEPERGRVKPDPEHMPGPRYSHSAVYAAIKEKGTRPNSRMKPVPSLIVYGGYSSHSDHSPRSEVHVLNIRTCRWVLHRVDPHALAPHRANHAAAVTKSQRFMVIHGGNYSDDNDASIITDELFVFHLQDSRWFVPVRHPSSANPPSARRRHSLVNGVGRHEGSLILYGGHLREGNFSNDMYLCHIIEPPVSGGQKAQVGIVWEKIDVRGCIQRPLDGRTKNTLKRRTVAGGCLIPVPKLRKYILLGGKSELGLREMPLLLDPCESDEIAISLSVPAEEEEEEEEGEEEDGKLAPVQERVAALGSGDDIPETPSCNSDGAERDEGEDIVFDMQKNIAQHLPAGHTKRPRSMLSTPTGEKPSSARRTPSVSVTPNEKSPNPSRQDGNAGDSDNHSRPTTNVHGAIAVRLRVRSAEKKKVESSPGNEDFVRAIKKRPRHLDNEHVTPPTKRGRFLIPEETDDISPLDFGDDNDSDPAANKGSANKSLSSRLEFLSASELARKGKKAGRGRGRGRAGSMAASRALLADDRAEEKRREALQKLNEKNQERIAYLEAENQDLLKEIAEVKKDSHDLNEQHIRLLEHVRISRAKQDARQKELVTSTATQARKPHDGAPGSQVENNARSASSVTEVDTLRATIAELQADITRKTLEKDELAGTIHDLEEEKREVQKEVFMMKNKVERTVIDRDSCHNEIKELRKDLVATTKDKEEAEKCAQQAKENLKLKQGELEMLKSDLTVERQRRQDVKLELSTADRVVKVVKGQLTEAAKRSDDGEAREKQLKEDLAKAEERNGFVQQQLDDLHSRNRKLADEKIEISAELESTRIELHRKLKECTAALKDVEKSREALERERLKRMNEDVSGDYARMKAEVERTKKECSVLRARCERFGRLKDLLPRIQAISEGVSAVLVDDKEDEEVELALSQARGEDRINGIMGQHKGSGGNETPLQGDRNGITEPVPNVGNVNQKPAAAQEPEEDPVTIPDSDDADEP